ncbi:MAG: gamma-glutamyl-gamma-aminobutyrate hydrolase family protein [Haloechinothrix sp.]
MNTRPLIGVAGMRSASISGLRRSGSVAAERVLEAVYRAGGEPLTLFHGDPAELGDRLVVLDGVVLPGGNDLDPRRYGAPERHPATGPTDDTQDEADLAVAMGCLRADMPMLAICRGMQVLNVALGGTLVQHLEPSSVDHVNGFHQVRLEPGSLVAHVMGATTLSVSSYHHQAVGRVGRGLSVVGRASDGCVEALQHAGAPVLAVQWHPEDDAAEAPPEQALFDWVVEQARNSSRTVTTGAVA